MCFFPKAQKYEPVYAKEIPVIDTFYSNYIIEDKYRWLENTDGEDTKEWVDKENAMSQKFLSRTTTHTNSYNLIDKYSYVKFDNPQKDGDYYFTFAYYNFGNIPALFYQSSLNAEPKLLIDPKFISSKDRIVITDYSVSKNSKYMAYQFSRNGSDWAELKVLTLPGGIDKKDHLVNVKFSNIAWKDDGFYYSTFLRTGQWGKAIGQKVCYHKIGTDQSEDKVIFKREKSIYLFSFLTSSNERFFILREDNIQRGTTSFFYIDFNSGQPAIRPLITNLRDEVNIIDSHNGKLIAKTFLSANNGSIVEIDPSNPTQWRLIVEGFPEAVLQKVVPFSDRIVAVYYMKQHPVITIFNYSGKALHSLEMPVGTSVDGLNGESTDEKINYYVKSYIMPPVVYNLNIKTYKEKVGKMTTITYGYDDLVIDAAEYPSGDGVKIPMLIVHKKDLKLNGDNPLILKTYGGFGIFETPSFDPGIVYFVKKGGVFAYAKVRGGGEKGSEWAIDGRGLNKQNSIEDFIYAAKYLIKQGYTNSNKLAALGASNGGLVVAAAVIQQPELFKVAVPQVAPLDMIRFENFSVGHWLVNEYGTVSDSLGFVSLLNYSPYQNIKETINYPSMLVITSENDDRVPPFHSYKFVARLQNRPVQQNPILLKVEKNAGHYGASNRLFSIKEKAEIFGFITYELENN